MLSKEFIESNGGQIEVASEFGVGTEFILTLPVADRITNVMNSVSA